MARKDDRDACANEPRLWSNWSRWRVTTSTDEIILDEKAAAKFLTPAAADSMDRPELANWRRSSDFTEANIERAFASTLEELGLKMGELAQPVRVALTGSTVSPGIHDVIAVLGKERTVARLNQAVARAKA